MLYVNITSLTKVYASVSKRGLMALKNIAKVFGVAFLTIGILGFVLGITNSDELLLGIFQISVLHNIIHILSGAAALLAAKSDSYAKMYLLVFGVVYAIVALIGWLQGDTVFGVLDVNTADNLLHTVLAAAILGSGLAIKSHGSDTNPASE